MAINLGCKTIEYYTANGNDTDYLFSFQIIKEEDLYVAVYDETTGEYNNVKNWTRPDSTNIIRFYQALPDGTEFIIYRLTDVDPLRAIFHPGHPVKAGDLNDNFEQLQFAIEDARCMSGGGSSGGGDGGGSATKIAAVKPITQSYNSATNTYTVGFDITSLNPIFN